MTVFGDNHQVFTNVRCERLSRIHTGVRLFTVKLAFNHLTKLHAHHQSPHQTSWQLFNYSLFTTDDSRLSQLVIILKIFIISNPIFDTIYGWHFVSNGYSVDLHSNYLSMLLVVLIQIAYLQGIQKKLQMCMLDLMWKTNAAACGR